MTRGSYGYYKGYGHSSKKKAKNNDFVIEFRDFSSRVSEFPRFRSCWMVVIVVCSKVIRFNFALESFRAANQIFELYVHRQLRFKPFFCRLGYLTRQWVTGTSYTRPRRSIPTTDAQRDDLSIFLHHTRVRTERMYRHNL